MRNWGEGGNHGFHGWARMALNLDRDRDLDPDRKADTEGEAPKGAN